MIDMTRTEGSKFLFEGAHEAAVPAALQALRFRYIMGNNCFGHQIFF